MTYLPDNAEQHVGKPKRLKSPTDASDACTHMLSIADDLRRPTDNSKCIRIPQNHCKKPNSPARSQKSCPKKPQWLRNDVNASGMGTYA